MDIRFESLNESHIDGICEINKLSFATPWSKQSIENELTNRLARYIVAIDNDKVVGYCGLWLIVDEGDITNIAVHPDYRGNHISSYLLNNMIDLCKKEKATSITLEVRKSNIIAQNLYKKFGFVEEGIRKGYYQDNGEDCILMGKRNLLNIFI